MLQELREKHPRFIYESFQAKEQNGNLQMRFKFLLEPNVVFSPEVILPPDQSLNKKELDNFVFHLGLIEMISYWKATCSPEILVNAGRLTDQQIAWWHDLFINGLGEFFYRNKIDPTTSNFLHITSNETKESCQPLQKSISPSGDLILFSGGKDSTVTLEILKDITHRKTCFTLNPIRSSLEGIKIAGYPEPLIAKRTIDKNLLELNQKGYLNGHTPFSAYLAFLGIFVGALNNYENIIASNDRGADEENIIFHNMKINHQYSRSFQFEKLFREYCTKYLTKQIKYFSFLRPLYELQISHLLANYPEHYFSFRSCNVGQKEDLWCGACAKCAFVYASLFPYLPFEKMMEIFGKDYYRETSIEPFIRQLVGLGQYKPFECVGLKEESILAVGLAIQKYRSAEKQVPPLLLSLEKELGIDKTEIINTLKKRVENGWNQKHFLPPEYAKLLKKAISKIQKR
jgi:hypothetical protein